MDIKVTEDISSEFVEIVRDILEDEEFRKLSGYIQHVKTTRLIHSLNVSYISWKMARKLGCDEWTAARAGLLHDFFLYRFSDPKPVKEFQAFYHPKVAARNSTSGDPVTHVSAGSPPHKQGGLDHHLRRQILRHGRAVLSACGFCKRGPRCGEPGIVKIRKTQQKEVSKNGFLLLHHSLA